MSHPPPLLIQRTSGHVERFTDLMVKDTVTHDFIRADHLLKGQWDSRFVCLEPRE